jgi:protocatechuate 3,4-dioxygenase beta subunit
MRLNREIRPNPLQAPFERICFRVAHFKIFVGLSNQNPRLYPRFIIDDQLSGTGPHNSLCNLCSDCPASPDSHCLTTKPTGSGLSVSPNDDFRPVFEKRTPMNRLSFKYLETPAFKIGAQMAEFF